MRLYTKIIIVLLLSWATTSCVKDSVVSGEEDKVTIEISTRGLLPTSDPTDPDKAVTSVRIMAFYRSGKMGAQTYVVPSQTNPPATLELELGVGFYDFVFIVNEDSDPRLKSILDAYSTNGKGLGDLQNEYAESSAFRNDYSIPMTRLIRNVTVTKEADVILKVNNAPVSIPWEVSVIRAGIRIDLFMETSDALVAASTGFSKLEVLRVPKSAYLFDTNETTPKINVTGSSSFETYTATSAPAYRTFANNQGDVKGTKTVEFTGDVDYTLTAGNLSFVQNGAKWYWYKRIVLPYTAFLTPNTPGYGIQLRAWVFGLPYTITLSNPAEDNYIIPRNSRYKINATLNPDYIQFSVSVKNWGSNTNVEIPFTQ